MTILNSISSDHMEMWSQHRQLLRELIRQLQEHEAKLDEKIAFYQRKIKQNQKMLKVCNVP